MRTFLLYIALLLSGIQGLANPPEPVIRADSMSKHLSDEPGITTIPGDDIAAAIRTANATALARFFNASLDISLPNTDLTCSKSQAEQIIRDFFSKNPPKTFKINHQGSSKDGSLFYIGTYVSAKGKSFRTYFLLKKVGDLQLIHQLQFEEE